MTETEEYGPALRGEKLVERARQCFKLVNEAETEQRRNEREDLEFQIPENQWSEAAKQERQGGVYPNGQPYGGRPMLSIDLLAHPRQLGYNGFSKAALGVSFHPVGEKASKDTAEALQGLYRRIERDSNANQARGFALKRTLNCGRGFYRVGLRYDADSDDPFDQEVYIDRILYQESVYLDPAAIQPDFSDAEWAFVAEWYSQARFQREFPDVRTAGGSSLEWEALERDCPEWVKADGPDKSYRVAEYWFKDIQRTEIKGPKGQRKVQERTRLYVVKMCGYDLLEEPYEWPSEFIPIVPVFGDEQVPVNGKRLWYGMTRRSRDGQMFHNYAASNMVEAMALEPKAPWMIAEGQDEGYEHEYLMSNVRNLPALHYKPVALGDKQAPPPTRTPVDSSRMNLAITGLQIAKGLIQSTTAVTGPSLGELPDAPGQQSGRALLALQQQTDAGTSQYLDNMRDISMPYESKVVKSLFPYAYDRPGRITRITSGEDETESIMLGKPFIKQNGEVKAVPPGTSGARMIDFNAGKYGVTVSVGKSYQTRLQEGGDKIGEVLTADPQLMPLIGATYFRYQDWPGATELADILLKVRNQQYPMLVEGDENSPDALKAQLGGLQGQMQQMQQQLQQATQALQTKQVETQGKVQIEQAKVQAQMQMEQAKGEMDLKIAEMNNAAKIEIARIAAAKASLDTSYAAQEELLATGIKAQAEMAQTAVEHEHEERLMHQEHAHQAGMALAKPNDAQGGIDERT